MRCKHPIQLPQAERDDKPIVGASGRQASPGSFQDVVTGTRLRESCECFGDFDIAGYEGANDDGASAFTDEPRGVGKVPDCELSKRRSVGRVVF